MFSNQDSARPQRGHAEAGQTIDVAARQAMDADVQEAADDRAEQRPATIGRTGSPSWRRRAVALRLVGQRKQRRRRRQSTLPSGVDLVRRAGRDRAGRREDARRESSGRQSRRRHAARSRANASTAGCSDVDLVERVELHQPPLGVGCAASRPRPTARIACHIVRDDCRSPPCASVVAASDRSHHGAPGTSAGLVEPAAAAW